MLDLGQATLHGPETTLHVRNYFGTITLLVPRGVLVEVDGGAAFLHAHFAGPGCFAFRIDRYS